MKALRIDHAITARDQDQLRRYLREISRYPQLETLEERELSEKIKSGDQLALDYLVQCNLRFVVTCAKTYEKMKVPLSDLINEGNIGLIRAAKRFDGSQGFRFISYAVFYIRHSILDYLGENLYPIRHSGNQFKKSPAIKASIQKLEQQLERTPSDEEILDSISITPEMLSLHREFSKPMHALDSPIGEDGMTLLDQLPSEGELPDHRLIEESNRLATLDLLKPLKAKKRHIMKDLYGLETSWPNAVENVAKKYKLTMARIRQINEEAIEELRKLKKEKASPTS